ncbi:MAG: DUF2809 domain-containing protein [Cyanobacteria bacterium P01_E01_bin.35]
MFSKAYTGIGQDYVRDYVGDVLYEIFWCLFIFWLVDPLPGLAQLKNTTRNIALWIFLITCVIEISQLWFYLVPDVIKSSLIWRLLLGAGFAWWDFPHYALGSLIGWGIIYQIGRMRNMN